MSSKRLAKIIAKAIKKKEEERRYRVYFLRGHLRVGRDKNLIMRLTGRAKREN